MPKLLIKFTYQQDRTFEINKGSIVIGRGEECDLILPNASISKEHTKLTVTDEGVFLEDLGSQNGLYIKNKRTKEGTVLPQEEFRLGGTFTLVYLSDRQEDNFYRGKAIRYLPKYNPKNANPNQDATFKLSSREAAAMIKEKGLLENGCIVSESGRDYYPEGNALTFGDHSAMIDVKGWFTGSTCAVITWDGKRHILEKCRMFTHVSINKSKIQKRSLTPGDRVQIGKSLFSYVQKS
jgi:hypothetical protein